MGNFCSAKVPHIVSAKMAVCFYSYFCFGTVRFDLTNDVVSF